MATETEVMVIPLTENYVSKDWDANKWRHYVNEATVHEISASLEKGQRITDFYNTYWLDRDKWGGSWEEAAKNTLGLSVAYCYKYLLISRVFNKKQVVENVSILPAQTDILALLAKAALTDRQTFQTAVKEGRINANMTREDATVIAKIATTTQHALISRDIQEGLEDDHLIKTYEISPKYLKGIHAEVDKTKKKSPSEIVDGEVVEGKEVKVTQIPNKPQKAPVLSAPVKAVEKPSPAISEPLKIVGEGTKSPFALVRDALNILEQRIGYELLMDMIDMWKQERDDGKSVIEHSDKIPEPVE